MINIFLGICAVLAMLMIVIGGIEYMTSELVSSKEHGKNQIWQAILGLILALSAWILLNEINPKLLELCLDRLPEATPVLQDDREEYSENLESQAALPSAPIPGCEAGMATITTTNGANITGCKNIVYSLQTMINDAAKENLNITGSGLRSRQRQVELRIQNCHCAAGDEYCINKKPSGQCTPPTASPGKSRHEVGMAFDLACDGKKIATKDNKCFLWLKNNAGRYKLKNYPREPWHWSVDGK